MRRAAIALFSSSRLATDRTTADRAKRALPQDQGEGAHARPAVGRGRQPDRDFRSAVQRARQKRRPLRAAGAASRLVSSRHSASRRRSARNEAAASRRAERNRRRGRPTARANQRAVGWWSWCQNRLPFLLLPPSPFTSNRSSSDLVCARARHVLAVQLLCTRRGGVGSTEPPSASVGHVWVRAWTGRRPLLHSGADERLRGEQRRTLPPSRRRR